MVHCIRGNIKNWISSFLNNHTQCVVLDGISSPKCSVLSGVPQGTVLGPTLFSIYINDLPETISHSSVKLFADNCILYKAICTPDDVEKLQEDLSAFQDWQQKWLMKLNISKCYIMRVSHPRRNKIISSYKIYNYILSSVDHHKYLGIIIQINVVHLSLLLLPADSTLFLFRSC